MAPRSRQILTQMTIILVASVATTVLVLLWKHADVLAFLLGDLRPLVLNGVVLVLFALGLGHLYRALRHYARQEAQIETFLARRAEGVTSASVLAEFDEP